MYCDVNPDGRLANLKGDKEWRHRGPPRQQVFETLTRLLKEDKRVCFILPTAVMPTGITLR